MELEHFAVAELRKQIIAVIQKYIDTNIYRIFFFGSRVVGNNFAAADIDLGIDGSTAIPSQIKLKIQEELEIIPMLYKIDFVDFNTVFDKFK